MHIGYLKRFYQHIQDLEMKSITNKKFKVYGYATVYLTLTLKPSPMFEVGIEIHYVTRQVSNALKGNWRYWKAVKKQFTEVFDFTSLKVLWLPLKGAWDSYPSIQYGGNNNKVIKLLIKTMYVRASLNLHLNWYQGRQSKFNSKLLWLRFSYLESLHEMSWNKSIFQYQLLLFLVTFVLFSSYTITFPMTSQL